MTFSFRLEIYNLSNIGKHLAIQILLGCLLWLVNWSSIAIAQSRIQFVDQHLGAGFDKTHYCVGDQDILPRLMVGGLALFDYDNDGATDVYLLNQYQSDLLGLAPPNDEAVASGNRLYRNVGYGRFQDVTEAANASVNAFSLGVTAGDIDNDGDQDLALSNFGPFEILINNGDGSFSKTSAAQDTSAEGNPFGAGIALLDIDNDGSLDLFAGRYVEFQLERHNVAMKRSFPYPPGPKDFAPARSRLFRNQGDGRFLDVSERSGLDALPGPTMGVICGDWDDDGDMDIFSCSDAAPNQLFANDGNGVFSDIGLAAGVAFDALGNVNGSMGVDSGDFDRDGKMDLLITNYTGQIPVLYKNLGGGIFEDVSRKSRIGRTLLPHTNWGVVWVDAENDGDLDAFIANGHFLKNIHDIDNRTDFRVTNTLLENTGNGQFKDVSSDVGRGFSVRESSRGAGFADFDLDGDLDGLVLNFGAEPTLLKNDTTPIGNWIAVHLIGVDSNRDAVGAKAVVHTRERQMASFVHSGRGYQSHYGTELHFGLGNEKDVKSIEVRWPNGKSENFLCDEINCSIKIMEGKGKSE